MRKSLLLFSFVILLSVPLAAQKPSTTVSLDAAGMEYQINKNIYGQFAEHLGHLIYGGIWVGPQSDIPNIDGLRKDVVEALRELKVPVLRWPGGCFADTYHWMDGIGPRSSRPKMINTNWGGVTEDNGFGTHEFLELCDLIGCEPYICGNVGSGSVEELSQWVEYVNSDNVSPMTDLRKKNGRDKSWGVKYWGIGNESWGCGGNMRPEFYADMAKRFGTFMHTYGGNRLFRIASGPNAEDYNWTTTLMKEAGSAMEGLSLHYYSNLSKRATDVDKAGWFDIMKKTLRMDELVTKHAAIMDAYDPFKNIALVVDEWGTWYEVEPGTNPGFLYQQNTLRDAVAAGSTLNIFNNHCDRVRMANIAQVVNVLQAMLLTDGKSMVRTPTYHVFRMYAVHQNAMMVPVSVASRMCSLAGIDLPAVNCSASIDTLGVMHVSLCNIDPEAPASVAIRLKHFIAKGVTGEVLTAGAMNAHNTFTDPEAVTPVPFNGAKISGDSLLVELPAKSVAVLALRGEVRHEPRPAIVLKNPERGLRYQYYETDGASMPFFPKLVPASSGTVDSVMIPNGVRESNFGVLYDAYINISNQGLYTLYTTSDDGSVLLIDGKVVVNNDGRHGPIERFGFVELEAGYHTFRLMFFQAGGGMELRASIKGPHMDKESIPVGMLLRER
ncbi:MAG TPA: alpha-L-arabinofuranosidase C-terminal domain-containing protein [Bacteroidota bacterium]|nr:alpha-L-arabinofuranosidase C-terminal domain-containing protein [Bacteroidota bacterium]